jgi:hypothetical protein
LIESNSRKRKIGCLTRLKLCQRFVEYGDCWDRHLVDRTILEIQMRKELARFFIPLRLVEKLALISKDNSLRKKKRYLRNRVRMNF